MADSPAAVDEDPRLLFVRVDASAVSFHRSIKKFRGAQLEEVLRAIRSLLLLNVDAAPRKLHLHQLTDVFVPSILDPKKKVKPWTFHVTSDDKYKASFTLEEGVVYLRLVGEHDNIDKRP